MNCIELLLMFLTPKDAFRETEDADTRHWDQSTCFRGTSSPSQVNITYGVQSRVCMGTLHFLWDETQNHSPSFLSELFLSDEASESLNQSWVKSWLIGLHLSIITNILWMFSTSPSLSTYYITWHSQLSLADLLWLYWNFVMNLFEFWSEKNTTWHNIIISIILVTLRYYYSFD